MMRPLDSEQLQWAEQLAASAYHKGFCEGTVCISVPWTALAIVVAVAWWLS